MEIFSAVFEKFLISMGVSAVLIGVHFFAYGAAAGPDFQVEPLFWDAFTASMATHLLVHLARNKVVEKAANNGNR